MSGSMEPGSVKVRFMAVYTCHDADYKQFELVGLVGGHMSVRTTFGPVTPYEGGLFRVTLKGAVQAFLWIPAEAKDLQARLMVDTHIGNGHRDTTAANLQVLRNYCVWQEMEKDVVNFVKKCLHCQDYKAGKMVPRPMGGVVHGESVGKVLHFDFLHVGASGSLGTEDVGNQGYQYLAVIVDDLSNFVWMEEAAT